MKKVVIHFKKYFKYINISFLIILLLSCENDEAEINEDESEVNSEFIGLNNISTIFDNLTRSYHIYVPSSYSVSEPIPIFFNLHGGASTATGYLNSIGDMR